MIVSIKTSLKIDHIKTHYVLLCSLTHVCKVLFIFNFTMAFFTPRVPEFPVFWFSRANELSLPAASFQETTLKLHL